MTDVYLSYLLHNREKNYIYCYNPFYICLSSFLFLFFCLGRLCTLYTWGPTEDFWCTCFQLKIQPYSQVVFPINQSGENSALSCWSSLCKAHASLQGLSGYWFCQFASITVEKQRPCAHNINSWNRRDISLLWLRLVKKMIERMLQKYSA